MSTTQAALLEALTEILELCAIGDVDESTEALGWGVAIQRARAALRAADAAQPADPMDWPLPCDVKVGHGTMRKGVRLGTLVTRMKVLYEMATGEKADEVAERSDAERAERYALFQADLAAGCKPVARADAATPQPAPIAAQADILAALMTCRAALRVLSEATDRDVRPGIWTMAGGWDALDKADHVMTMVKNHPPQLRPNTPSDARALAAMMEAAAGDPMWANHAEVNKATLQRAANALLFMAGQVEHLAACVDPAAFEEARPETAAEAAQRMAQEARDAADANWCAQQRSKEQ